jgi:glycerol-3-phosphate dehydrogenase (NAD(P)+)
VKSVALLGLGRFAEAVVNLLPNELVIRAWGRRPEARAEFEARHKGKVHVGDLEQTSADADVVIFAVPAGAMAGVARQFGEFARGDQIVIHACRGVGQGFALPHQMIRAGSCVRKIGVLGGPLHSHEIGTGRALGAVIASRYEEVFQVIGALVQGTQVRIHPSPDVIGVEVAGAISNVAALAAGMADALELGETARGVLLTHGLSEALRLGVKLGADPATFAGLAGVGDLIPRRVSSTDRHQEVGARLARGEPLASVLESLGQTAVEGVVTAQEALPLAGRLGLKLPLIGAVTEVLTGRQAARPALEAVLRSDLDLPVARAR